MPTRDLRAPESDAEPPSPGDAGSAVAGDAALAGEALELAGVKAGAWAIPVPARHVSCSERCRDLLGIEDGEPITVDRWLSLLHPDDHPRIAGLLAAAQAGEIDGWSETCRILHPRDGEQWRHDLARIQRDETGAVRGISGITIDLSARRDASEQSARLDALIQRQTAEIDLIYQSAPIGLGVLDRDLRFLRVNDRLAEFNGASAASHIGRTVREVVPAIAPDAEPLLRRVLETGEPALDIEIAGETQAMPGTRRTWREHWLPVHDASGEIVALNCVVEETTDRTHAEAERLAFMDAVAHDLRNPLAVIRASAQLLRRLLEGGLLTDEEVVQGLEMTERAVDQATALIDDLLDIARLRARQPLDLRPAPVDLASLVEEAVGDQRMLYPAHEFRVANGAAALEGNWDRVRLRRAIVNPLDNAGKYSPPGSVVSVRLEREDGEECGWAALHIVDQGIGIPAAELPQIFTMFHRARNANRHAAGSGIGLSGVRQIIEQHGGAISVTSAEGVGSTFTVRLPLPEAAR